MVYVQAVITSYYEVISNREADFLCELRTPYGQINNSWLALFDLGLDSKLFLLLRLKHPKISFATPTLKLYRTVNVDSKMSIKSLYRR